MSPDTPDFGMVRWMAYTLRRLQIHKQVVCAFEQSIPLANKCVVAFGSDYPLPSTFCGPFSMVLELLYSVCVPMSMV